MDNTQPIIVKRIKRYAAGHHGGAWKIAFADFATAMMAFFLVLWLMSATTPEQKKLISGYFQDPIGFSESGSPYVIDLGGTPVPAPDRTLNPQADVPSTGQSLDTRNAEAIAERLERERLDLVLQELQNKINEDPELKKFKDQILMDISRDGLRIQIRDAANRPMFALGSAQLQPYFEDILLAMVDTLKGVANKISISGHTDAKPYAGNGQFGNWELSANRANAARRTLVAGGYPDAQIARVVGYSSTVLFDRQDPLSAANRRIEILVLTKKAQESIEGDSSRPDALQPGNPSPAVPAKPAAGSVRPGEAGPLSATQLREQLDIFEDGVLNMQEQQ
ncbi:flagellar motor protein MotB [Azomonas macrocytogenes]|uniref:Chemotaxis protein MotB n=1 Tax=Azomonas macrocytogenes TaxID=69962 RepID=A0A839T3F4_AZOMA|nr:flagellar motor protein MotB [Azomonas macrocytogenes]MBB3102495.1 chemotaxis protein MotB [Azomonas macrocytogenes]